MACVFAARHGTPVKAVLFSRPPLLMKHSTGALLVKPSPIKISSRLSIPVRAARSGTMETSRDLSGLMATLRQDSPNLFTEQGMDLSIYANDVDFRDPITNYNDVQVCAKLLWPWHSLLLSMYTVYMHEDKAITTGTLTLLHPGQESLVLWPNRQDSSCAPELQSN